MISPLGTALQDEPTAATIAKRFSAMALPGCLLRAASRRVLKVLRTITRGTFADCPWRDDPRGGCGARLEDIRRVDARFAGRPDAVPSCDGGGVVEMILAAICRRRISSHRAAEGKLRPRPTR